MYTVSQLYLKNKRIVVGCAKIAVGDAGVSIEKPSRRIEKIRREFVCCDGVVGDFARGDAVVGNGVGFEGIGNGSDALAGRKGCVVANLDFEIRVAVEGVGGDGVAVAKQNREGSVLNENGVHCLKPFLGSAGCRAPQREANAVGSIGDGIAARCGEFALKVEQFGSGRNGLGECAEGEHQQGGNDGEFAEQDGFSLVECAKRRGGFTTANFNAGKANACHADREF